MPIARCGRWITWVLPAASVFVNCGCAAPSLEDAKIEEIRAATYTDTTILSNAANELDRKLYAGATIKDAQQGTITFSEDDYDAYQQYMQTHPALLPVRQASPNWPVLHISFFTDVQMIAPDTSKTVSEARAQLYVCDGGNATEHIVGRGDIMWSGHFVTGQVAAQFDTIQTPNRIPQKYEIFLPYTYWKAEQSGPRGIEVVTLMPPPGDLCLARVDIGYPTVLGRPLRIGHAEIIQALGPLPRSIRVQP